MTFPGFLNVLSGFDPRLTHNIITLRNTDVGGSVMVWVVLPRYRYNLCEARGDPFHKFPHLFEVVICGSHIVSATNTNAKRHCESLEGMIELCMAI